MKNYIKIISLLVLVLLLSQKVTAQKKELTFEQAFMFGQPRLMESSPSLQGWFDDENYLELKRGPAGTSLIVVNAESGDEETLIDYNQLSENVPAGINFANPQDNSKDFKNYLFSNENNLHFFNTAEGELRQLTDDEDEEVNAALSPDSRYAAYTKNHDLYAVDTETGKEIRLTNDGAELIYNGYASWVYYEEILGRSSRYRAFWWSPNSEYIAFLRFDDSPVPLFPIHRATPIPHGDLERTRYPKAGDPNPEVKLGIANVKTGKVTWVNTDDSEDRYIAWAYWTKDSKQLLYQWLNRDQNHMVFYLADPTSGETKKVYEEKQDTWIDFFADGDLHMMDDNSGFIIRSDVSGWRHLYYYDYDGNLKNKITNGEWRVNSIEKVDEANGKVYFMGTGGVSTERHLFVVDLDGSDMKQLTQQPGVHSSSVSKNGSYFYTSYSTIKNPTKVEVYDGEGKLVRLIKDTKSDIYDDYQLANVELFTIKNSDGFEMPAKWYLPSDFDENKKYPVLFDIYGGPDAGTVYNSFGWGFTGHYLAEQGIIVISVDHRGSGHFGKKGLNYMHRNFGKYELDDYIDAVKWLEEKPFVDKDKIAITGGSYGGYMTCIALTRGSDYFDYGIANYSVTDYRLYDNIYTERYMDTPEDNPEGYDYGSAIYHADKYKGEGRLYITHGTMDDNVHMQNTIAFIDELINLNKDFEFMLYPGERHGVGWQKRGFLVREAMEFWNEKLLDKK